MTSRTRKAIERMMTRAIPTAPIGANWFAELNNVFLKRSNRSAMGKARALVRKAMPLMKPYDAEQWMKL